MSSAVQISLLSLFLLANLAVFITALPPYLYDGYMSEDFPMGSGNEIGDRGELTMDRLLQGLNKRSCIRRGSRCDHRPDDCCSGGACRCNLWGANCQCQRMGIFQKWG